MRSSCGGNREEENELLFDLIEELSTELSVPTPEMKSPRENVVLGRGSPLVASVRIKEQGAGGLKAAAEAMSKAVSKTVRVVKKKYDNAEVVKKNLQFLPAGFLVINCLFSWTSS